MKTNLSFIAMVSVFMLKGTLCSAQNPGYWDTFIEDRDPAGFAKSSDIGPFNIADVESRMATLAKDMGLTEMAASPSSSVDHSGTSVLAEEDSSAAHLSAHPTHVVK